MKIYRIYIYIYIEDEQIVDSSGKTMLYSMLGLLSFNLAIAIFCSSGMSFLFPLFNLIQLINLLPLLSLDFPENLRVFISTYLQFANLKFEFLVNPLHQWNIVDLSQFNTPLNDNFERNGIGCKQFVVNYGGQLIIWTIIIFLYIPITIVAKCCKIKKFIEIKSAYEFNILLASFTEAFLEFSLLSFLNIYEV